MSRSLARPGLSDRTLEESHGEMGRIRFVSRNLLRLQGLWAVPLGLSGIGFFFAMSGLGLPFNILLVPVATGLPLLLYPVVIWYYPRVLGEVHYSKQQTGAIREAGERFSLYVSPTLVLDLVIEPSVSLVSLGFAAAVLHQWVIDDARTKLLHYPLAALVATITGLLPLVVTSLPTSIYNTSGQSTLYFGALPACVVLIGVCDHLVLTSGLRDLPEETS